MTKTSPPKVRIAVPPPSAQTKRAVKTAVPAQPPAIAPMRNPPAPQGGFAVKPSPSKSRPPAPAIAKKTNTAPMMAAPPAGMNAYLEKKREAVQAKEQARARGEVELPVGTRFNERLPDDFQPSNPTEAMFYQVFGDQGIDGDPIDDMPFLFADRAMPSPKG